MPAREAADGTAFELCDELRFPYTGIEDLRQRIWGR
jgi:hypothetical protein